MALETSGDIRAGFIASGVSATYTPYEGVAVPTYVIVDKEHGEADGAVRAIGAYYHIRLLYVDVSNPVKDAAIEITDTAAWNYGHRYIVEKEIENDGGVVEVQAMKDVS